MVTHFAPETSPVTRKLTFPSHELVSMLCGEQNAHLQLLNKRIGLSVNVRGNHVTLQGGDWETELAEKVLSQLYGLLEKEYPLYANDVEYAIRILSSDPSADLRKIFLDKVYIASNKNVITRRALTRKPILTASEDLISSSGLVQRAPEKPIWLWQWPLLPWSRKRSIGWSWPGLPLKRVSTWGFCQVTCTIR